MQGFDQKVKRSAVNKERQVRDTAPQTLHVCSFHHTPHITDTFMNIYMSIYIDMYIVHGFIR